MTNIVTCKLVDCGQVFRGAKRLSHLRSHQWQFHREIYANGQATKRKNPLNRPKKLPATETQLIDLNTVGPLLKEIEERQLPTLDDAINCLRIDMNAMQWAFGVVLDRLTAIRNTGSVSSVGVAK